MNTTNRANPEDLTCPLCGSPLEVTTILTDDGNYQEVLQCWRCYISTPGRKIMRIPLHAHKQPELAATNPSALQVQR